MPWVSGGAKGHRAALYSTAFRSYGNGWLQKAVVKSAHAKIWQVSRFQSWLEASMCMTVDPWIQGHSILTFGVNRLKINA